jgi:hypothetical protein
MHRGGFPSYMVTDHPFGTKGANEHRPGNDGTRQEVHG